MNPPATARRSPEPLSSTQHVIPWARAGVAAGLALLVAACAGVAPTGRVPAEPDIPLRWSQAASGTGRLALDGWWQRFEDPLLPALVAQAMQANSSVTGALAALRQARALRDAAGAALQPGVTGSAAAQQGFSDTRSTGRSFRAGLDASWELDLFGVRRNALRSADATALAREADLGDVQVSVAAEVGLSYIALRAAQVRLAIADDNLASQLRTLQLTEWRVQAGLLSALDAEQARAAAAQTQARGPALHTAVTQAGHALAVLTGRPPATWVDPLTSAGDIPRPPADLALSLPADTLRQRPDVRAAEHQVQAALGRVAQADAARYPSFTLGGSLGLQALTLGGLGSSALVTTLLAGVSGPLWDGGAARAQVRAQQAVADQARSVYRGIVLAALQDVEDVLVALRGDLERVQHLQRAAAAATQAATLAGQRYEAGLVDVQVVLETQRNRLATQDSLATASADVSADHVRLFKALGGGWRPSAASDTASPSSNAAAPAADPATR